MSKSGSNLQARARWQKWEMDNLNSRKKPAILKNTSLDKDLIKAAELNQQRALLMEQSKKAGYKDGYAKGHAEGFEAGKAKGWQTGSEQGYDEGLQNGQQEGYAQGLREGKTAGDVKATHMVAQLDQLINGFNKTLSNLEQEIGQSLVKLSIDIAKQVIRSQLKEHPEHINTVIHEAIESNNEQDTVLRILLNPSDLDLVQNHQLSSNTYQYKLVEQTDISPGGCIIETEHGSIDATIETRWLRIIGALGYANEY